MGRMTHVIHFLSRFEKNRSQLNLITFTLDRTCGDLLGEAGEKRRKKKKKDGKRYVFGGVTKSSLKPTPPLYVYGEWQTKSVS